RPEVVLLDVQLPDVDGFTVAEQLAAVPGPPRVVLISSRDAAAYGPRLAATPACGVLAKRELSGASLAALVGCAGPAPGGVAGVVAAVACGRGRGPYRGMAPVWLGGPWRLGARPADRLDHDRMRAGRLVAPPAEPVRCVAGGGRFCLVRAQLRRDRGDRAR